MNRHETRAKIVAIMTELNARELNEMKGPKDTHIATMETWLVGDKLVIVQYFKDGGCTHLVQGEGNTWEAMETELHKIAAAAL